MTRQARAQQRRRDAARSRGDCGVCCRRPAELGKFQCAACADRKRTQSREDRVAWLKRTRCDQCDATEQGCRCVRCGKERRSTGTYRTLRAAGLCVVCKADSPDMHACLACRLAMKIKREAARLWTASGSQGRCEHTPAAKTPHSEGQSV